MQWSSMFRSAVILLAGWGHASAGMGQESSQQRDLGQTRPPNIVIILIDDMGFADIAPFYRWSYQSGISSVPEAHSPTPPYATPNLDALADSGRMLTNFIVPSAVCSASRAGLMTGCLPERIGFRGALGPNAKTGIHANEVTLAELCKEAGYQTACFGKWHLGRPKEFLPLQHGFDEFYGIPYSNDMWPLHPAVLEAKQRDPNAISHYPPLPMIEGNEVVDAEISEADQQQMTQEFTRRAVEFIREHQDQPFFLYLPHAMVHVPLYSSPEFHGKSGAGPFGDAVQEIDRSVGEIVRALKQSDLTEETLLIFTSDNGPWLSYGSHAGSAGPLREGKGTSWEGGIRVPAIASWPGHIPAKTQVGTLASTIDLLPTVAAIIGSPLPDHPIDGVDISPLLLAETKTSEDFSSLPTEQRSQLEIRTIPIYYGDGELQAIRSSQGKVVFPHTYRTLGTSPLRDDGKPVPYVNKQVISPEYFYFDPNRDQPNENTSVDLEQSGELNSEARKHYEFLIQSAEQWRKALGDKLQDRTGREVRPIGQVE